MRKLIYLMLVGMMILGSLVGCASTQTSNNIDIKEIQDCSPDFNEEFSILTDYLTKAVIGQDMDIIDKDKNKDIYKHINKLTEIKERDANATQTIIGSKLNALVLRSITYKIKNPDSEKLSEEILNDIFSYYEMLEDKYDVSTSINLYYQDIKK